ncbi:hypothetical protein PJE062_4949 [Pseudovibrio sp. JE062]|nr:hypothetical protein PJE062_4949 [Pseudovibrio sp. JE062]
MIPRVIEDKKHLHPLLPNALQDTFLQIQQVPETPCNTPPA